MADDREMIKGPAHSSEVKKERGVRAAAPDSRSPQVAVQERRQLRGGVLLHRRQEVCVDPQRRLDFGVTESTLNTCAETLADSLQRRDGMPRLRDVSRGL
jgi:hypothetical protein